MNGVYSVGYAQTRGSNYFSFQTVFDWISGDLNVPAGFTPAVLASTQAR